LILIIIFLSGCTESTTKELKVIQVEEKFISDDLNKVEDEVTNKNSNKDIVIGIVNFLDPEDIIELKDGRKLVYKGNVSVNSVDGAEWKASFFLNNDPKRRYNLSKNDFLLIGGTQIIIVEFVTYQEGSVGI